jgi:hypothetical protein
LLKNEANNRGVIHMRDVPLSDRSAATRCEAAELEKSNPRSEHSLGSLTPPSTHEHQLTADDSRSTPFAWNVIKYGEKLKQEIRIKYPQRAEDDPNHLYSAVNPSRDYPPEISADSAYAADRAGDLKDFLGGIPAECHERVAYYLLESPDLRPLAPLVFNFAFLAIQDRTALAKAIFEAASSRGELWRTGVWVSQNLEQFLGVDKQTLADLLCRANCGHTVAKHPELFSEIDHARFAESLLSKGRIQSFCSALSWLSVDSPAELLRQRFESWSDPAPEEIDEMLDWCEDLAGISQQIVLESGAGRYKAAVKIALRRLFDCSQINYRDLSERVRYLSVRDDYLFPTVTKDREDFILAFPNMSDVERARAIFKFDPLWVAENHTRFPQISHDEIAAALFDWVSSSYGDEWNWSTRSRECQQVLVQETAKRVFPTLTQLAEFDRLAAALKIVEAGKAGFILHHKKFFGINVDRETMPQLVASLVRSYQAPEDIALAESFFDIPPEMVIRCVLEDEAVLLYEEDPRRFERWFVQCRGLSEEVARIAIERGNGEYVLLYRAAFEPLSKATIQAAALNAVTKLIMNGSPERAYELFKEHDLQASEVDTCLRDLRSRNRELGTDWTPLINQGAVNIVIPKKVEPALSFAVWSLLVGFDPPLSVKDRAFFQNVLAPFRECSPNLLQHLVAQRRFEPLVSDGIGLCKLLRDSVWPTILPEFLAQAGSKTAWGSTSGKFNCFIADNIVDIGQELRTILDFRREYNGIDSWTIYWVYRACGEKSEKALSLLAEEQLPLDRAGGRQALRRRLQQIEQKLLEWEGPIELSELEEEYLAAWTRVKNEGRFSSRLWRLNKDLQDGSIAPCPQGLTKTTLKVARRESTAQFSWSDGSIKRYNQFLAAFHEVRVTPEGEFFDDQKRRCFEMLLERRREVVEWLEQNPEKPQYVRSKEQAGISRIDNQIERIRSADSVERLFQLLSEFDCKYLRPVFFNVSLKVALRFHPDEENWLSRIGDEPSLRFVTDISELVGSNLKHACEELKLSSGQQKAIRHLMNLQDFSLDLEKHEALRVATGVASGQCEEILVYPTRGILAELAGYFAEACWTDHTELMRNHPNVTALIFAKQALPDGGITLAGACYLLRARDLSGNDVLIVRGINPREDEFHHLSMESFIEGLLDEVVVPYARSSGVKRVLIPFHKEAHTQSNRERVIVYLEHKYGNCERVALDPAGPSTVFNGRVIFDKCRMVRDLASGQ